MQKKITDDVVVGGCVTLVGILLLVVGIPYGVDAPSFGDTAALAPNFWPKIIAVFIVIAGLCLIVGGLKSTGNEPEVGGEEVADDEYPVGVQAVRFLLSFLILFMVYFCIDYFGMVLTTFVATLGFLLIGKVRKPIFLIGIPVILPCMLYGFFVYAANVPLPIGDLFYAFM